MFSHSLLFCVPSNNPVLKIRKWTFGHCPTFLIDEIPGYKCLIHGPLTCNRRFPSVRRSSYRLLPMISLCVSPTLFQIHSVPTMVSGLCLFLLVRAVVECMPKINRPRPCHKPCFYWAYWLNWEIICGCISSLCTRRLIDYLDHWKHNNSNVNNITHSEQSANCLLPRAWAHRFPQFVSGPLSDRF